MNKKSLLTALTIIILISLSSTGNATVSVRANDHIYCVDNVWNAEFTPLGLEGMHVESLATTAKYIYAGTTEGLYRKDISQDTQHKDCIWEFLGFEGETVNSLYIDPMYPSIIHVGLYINCPINSNGEPHSLFKSINEGQTWKPIDEGIQRVEQYSFLDEDIYIPDTRLPICCVTAEPGNPKHLYATSYSCIFKSTNGGGTWNIIWGDPCALGNGIHTLIIDPNNVNNIWAGGESSMYSAIIIKSIDGGNNWEYITPAMGGDNACYTLAFHPLESNVVYAGMEGKLAKTTDSGVTWDFILSPPQTPYIRGLVINPIHPNRIYAGGACNTPSAPLTIWASNNNGETWDSCSIDEAEMVRTIVLDPKNPDLLYIGTMGTGVYMCKSINWGPHNYSPE